MPIPSAFARRGAALALACFAGNPASGAAAGPASPQERYVREIERSLDGTHWSAESIDRDGLMREIQKRIAAGESPAVIGAWLDQEVTARWWAFAPINPSHPANEKFHLPFDRRINWIVGQGVSGAYSHTGSEQFSLDFAMPEGTPILAAQHGTVARVVDGFTRCCLPTERSHETNLVIVLHANGTFASYAHLRSGISVKEGQRIRAGELLGYSGSTGYAAMPHLHFSVSVLDASKRPRTIPIRFRNGTPGGYVPKHWRFYQNRRPATALLEVSVNGRALVSGRPFPLDGRAPVQLRVALADLRGGEAIDVTRDPGTRYVALTPWSLQISDAGRVEFGARSSQWAPLPEVLKSGLAIVTILFESEDKRRGEFDAWFRFLDADRFLKDMPRRAPPGPAR